MKIRKFDVISFTEALKRAVGEAPIVRRMETVLLDSAAGRILSEEIYCRKNLPSFDNAAMDGFAVRSEDAGKRVKIVAAIFAGDRPRSGLRPGSCYRIMTGAQVPSDADTVVPIEACREVEEASVVLPKNLKRGNNLRQKGEEQQIGTVLMQKGERLDPFRIAMLAAQGIMAVKVYAPLRIAVLSTGNEIREPWEIANEEEIYNANAFGIMSLLKKFGFNPSYVGSLSDSFEVTKRAVSGLEGYNAILTTGGISMGEADFLEEAFFANALVPLFHGINVKPGRPTMMGCMKESFVMAMPGNPLATMLNTFLLTLPVLFRMQGAAKPHFPFIFARNAETFRAKATRSNLVLGRVEKGCFHAVWNNRVGSGMLTPLMESNCIAVLGERFEAPSEGEEIKVIFFDSFPSEKQNGAYNLNEEWGAKS